MVGNLLLYSAVNQSLTRTILTPKVGTDYTGVTGSFVVPEPSTDGGGAGWVGLDGSDNNCPTVLQAGVFWTKDGPYVEYRAFFEWWPEPPEYPILTVSPGDTLKGR